MIGKHYTLIAAGSEKRFLATELSINEGRDRKLLA
jgi:hypothetical protein